jgi:hypothetical protein
MSDAGASEEWDVVVPEDGETLMDELRRHGVKPGQVLHMRSAMAGKSKTRSAASGKYVTKGGRSGRVTSGSTRTENGAGQDARPVPSFFRSIRSGEEHLGRRSEEILRAEFPAPGE